MNALLFAVAVLGAGHVYGSTHPVSGAGVLLQCAIAVYFFFR